MHYRLLTQTQPTGQQMGISITGQEHALEKKQASGPDARCAAKPRQDVLADEWLNLKQEECTGENGKPIEGHLPVKCRGWRVIGHVRTLAEAEAWGESIPRDSVGKHGALT